MNTVSIFDARELAELLTHAINSDFIAVGLHVEATHELVSKLIKSTLDDLITALSSWMSFEYHPDVGPIVHYQTPMQADQILVEFVESHMLPKYQHPEVQLILDNYS